MKKTSTIILCFCIAASVAAQQRPHYSQYVLNNYIVNPAVTGIENYADIKMSMRNQWVGIPGAPKTVYFTAHTPLNKKDYRENVTSLGMKNNPMGYDFTETYNSAEPHHGIGVSAFNYTTGYINRINAMVNYAYHMGLNETWNLGGGFGGGFSHIAVNRSQILIENPNDPLIGSMTGIKRKFKPDLSAGLFLYSKKYFFGLSGQQLIPAKLDITDTSYQTSLVPHLFGTAGIRIALNEYVSFLPSVMFRYIKNTPITVDYNLKLQYTNFMWIGANVRRGDGISALAGINFNSTLNVSYAYDMTARNTLLGPLNKGTHELVVGFVLNNRYNDMSPRKVW